MNEPLKIFALPACGGAIGALRIIEPCQIMSDQNLALTRLIPVGTSQTQKDVHDIVVQSDLMWFQGNLEQMYLWNVLNCRRWNPKLKLVIDIDDNLYAVNPWNPSFQAFSTVDKVQINEKTSIEMPKARNHSRIRILETLVMEADALITTTPVLATVYSHLQSNIYIMPNRLIWHNWHFDHIPRINDGKVRISWQGGSSHMMDWIECHAACKRIIEKYPQTKMQFQTSPGCYQEFLRDFGQEHVDLYDWIDYSGHSFRMNCLKPDIAVIPLHEDEFSVSKSDLKFAEYSAIGIPSVCSNISPYKDSVIHGETGFLASSDSEFEKYLEILVNDEPLRLKMGKAAYDWAYENRCAEKGAIENYNLLKEILAQPTWHVAEYLNKTGDSPESTKKELAIVNG